MVAFEIHDLNPLFQDVQMKQIFPDGKTFVDCVPKFSIEEINNKYEAGKKSNGFNLKEFVFINLKLICHNLN